MNFSDSFDAVSGVKVEYGSNTVSFTAGTTYDNVKVTTESIDRLGFDSAQVVLPYSATLTTDKAAALTLAILDSDDNSNWNTAIPLATAITMASTAGASTGVYKYNIDLNSYSRYIKFETTVNLTATGTDTIAYGCHAVLAGAKNRPVS